MRRRYANQVDEESNTVTRVSESHLSDKLTYLLVGGGIGAVVALLLAPKAGRELRGDLADATRKGYDKTLETAQQVRGQSGEYYQQLKQNASNIYQRRTRAGQGLSAESGVKQVGQSDISSERAQSQTSNTNQLNDRLPDDEQTLETAVL